MLRLSTMLTLVVLFSLSSLFTLVPHAAAGSSLGPTTELFSSLVAQKLAATAQSTSGVPSQFPQYTTRDTGEWLYFPADTWTSGFLPATFYAMYERASFCPHSLGETSGDQWLEFGRAWSTGEIPLEIKTGVGHDVGFLSYPFVDELHVCACFPNL